MYDYRVIRPLALRNSNELHVLVDLGFSTTTEISFRLARVKAPDLDFAAELDPEIAMRNFIVQWLKTAPGPLVAQIYKNNGVYSGDVIDANGNVLADDLIAQGLVKAPNPPRGISEDDTVFFGNALPSDSQ